jgi:hypothetical protein
MMQQVLAGSGHGERCKDTQAATQALPSPTTHLCRRPAPPAAAASAAATAAPARRRGAASRRRCRALGGCPHVSFRPSCCARRSLGREGRAGSRVSRQRSRGRSVAGAQAADRVREGALPSSGYVAYPSGAGGRWRAGCRDQRSGRRRRRRGSRRGRLRGSGAGTGRRGRRCRQSGRGSPGWRRRRRGAASAAGRGCQGP